MRHLLSFVFSGLAMICFPEIAWGQTSPSALPPVLPDVIVKYDGELIRAEVLEVGYTEIKYRRMDQTNGPVYIIPRAEVVSISYGDNTVDYLDAVPPGAPPPALVTQDQSFFEKLLANPKEAYVGLGFFERFSKVEEIEGSYDRDNLIAPAFFLGFQSFLNSELFVGAQLGFGRYNYSGGAINIFDYSIIRGDVEERVTTLGAFGGYRFDFGNLKPYVKGGLAINHSYLLSTLRQEFDDEVLILETNARISSVGFILRGGVVYQVTDPIGVYADLGTGTSILQIGGALRIN